MIEKELLEKIAIAENLKGNDKSFFLRVWNTDISVYQKKLKAWGIENFNHVLDAGSGFGQWSYSLALLNTNVTAIEFSNLRANSSKKTLNELKIKNCQVIQGSIENTPFGEESFDAVFAYSSVLCTDFRKTLKEFYRILKPKGKLYFNANGLGWYIYNLIEGHNPAYNFSPRQMAIDTLKNSLKYYIEGTHEPGQQILLSKENCLKYLNTIGFNVIAHGGEGTVSISTKTKNISFFKEEYLGEEGVFEILAEKVI